MTEGPIYRLDRDRRERIGIAEAVFCQRKTVEQIALVVDEAVSRGENLFLTHFAPAQFEAVARLTGAPLDYEALSRTAILAGPLCPSGWRDRPPIEIVSAGTSDLAVAMEAERTLFFHGVSARRITDVGVAGLYRILDQLDRLRACPVVIVCAGMDAALPTVLAGLIAGALIAVPTSVGYGVAKGGETALRACLASCAPGVTVVNIDNGFGAACAALRILSATSLLNGRELDAS
jgi:pyridinium-3,5-biscarboxylic acid mononucleotide synthase